MGTCTINPNSVYHKEYDTEVGGVLPDILHDGLDTTYCYQSNQWGAYCQIHLDFDDITQPGSIPAGAQIRSITVWVRLGTSDGVKDHYNSYHEHQCYSPDHKHLSPLVVVKDFSAIANYAVQTLFTASDGSPWTVANVNTFRTVLWLYDTGGSHRPRIYLCWAVINYNEVPVCTATGPTGTLTTTTQPTFTWTYSDPDHDPQEAVCILVYDSSVYGAGGFDPYYSSAQAAWNSGPLNQADTQLQCGVPLPNAKTYRAYITCADATPAGYAQKWANYSYVQFNISLTPPGTPSCGTPTWDSANGKATERVTAGSLVGTGASSQTVALQRSTDGGSSWQAVRGAQAIALGAAGTFADVLDYDVPRNVRAQYRAQATVLESGSQVSSVWSASSASVSTARGSVCAFLKSPSNPAVNMVVRTVGAEWDGTSAIDDALFEPRGRTTPIIHTISAKSWDFPIVLWFNNDSEWAAFKTLRQRYETYLLQLPYGDASGCEQYWIRMRDVDVAEFATPKMSTAQWRKATVKCREVAAPPS